MIVLNEAKRRKLRRNIKDLLNQLPSITIFNLLIVGFTGGMGKLVEYTDKKSGGQTGKQFKKVDITGLSNKYSPTQIIVAMAAMTGIGYFIYNCIIVLMDRAGKNTKKKLRTAKFIKSKLRGRVNNTNKKRYMAIDELLTKKIHKLQSKLTKETK